MVVSDPDRRAPAVLTGAPRVGGRLVDAYERERIRLSRELHDDVAQRVVLVAAQLGMLQQRLAGVSQEIQDEIGKLLQEIGDISAELHRVSHELHPARLTQIGLEASVRAFCAELSTARGLAIDLEIAGVPAMLDMEVALCLYRITQEALQNVVKHSGAPHAVVTLTRVHHELVLRIVDTGTGFDLHSISQKDTLGLTSMRERARLVRALLRVSSKPGGGTVIEVRVPLRRQTD